MPRVARIIAPGYPHHVTQRGNYGQIIFEVPGDYRRYLAWLEEYCRRYDLEIWSYCIMTNHVHFVCVPGRADSLSRTFNTLHMRYSQYVNRKKGASGHLWQGRFYSSILDEHHAYAAVRHVENNPVRAGLVPRAEGYEWSSAGTHVSGTRHALVADTCAEVLGIDDWQTYLGGEEDGQAVETVRKNTMTGRPSGSETFIDTLETLLGCRLRALPRGRPRRRK